MQRSSPRVAAGFAPLIAPFDVDALDALPSTVCGLWPDLRIGYVNAAWRSFAVANRALSPDVSCGLEVNVLAVVPTVLRPFHENLFARARDTREVAEHDYECSSPVVQRTFRLRVHACDSGAFVVVHSLLREAGHVARPCPSLDEAYRDQRGLIVQCSNCRHVRRARLDGGESAGWDWVPAYVAELPPGVSHGLCEVCAVHYYG